MARRRSTPPGRLSPAWRYGAVGAAVVVLAVVVVLLVRGGGETPTPPAPPPPGEAPSTQALYVNPTGNNSSDGSAGAPLRTIQAALERATPGTTINLAPGVYHEEPVTVQPGAPGAPITIKGPETGKDRSGRYLATVYGTGRVFSIDHSYYTLDGFTIDGQEELGNTPLPSQVSATDAFKDSVQPKIADSRLIYVGASDDSRDITGISISNMFLSGAGGECVRLRNNAHDNLITNSVIQYCGMYGKSDEDNSDRFEYHNGEGVYIGTSPKSDDQPMHDNDGSSGNTVSNNTIRTFGSECFNVKENAHDNVFEGNTCSGNTESVEFGGSNIELRGYGNTVRNNTISDGAGYGVKIQSDDEEYDKGGNSVESNELSGIAGEAFRIKSESTQGTLCGNTVSGARPAGASAPGGISSPC